MSIKIADLDRVMDNIRIKAPSVLDGVVHMELFNTFSDFFNKTNIWQEEIPLEVTSVNTRGTTADIVPTEGLILRYMWSRNADGIYRRMVMAVPGTVTFVDVTNAPETWTICVSKTVTDPVSRSGTLEGIPRVPDWVVTRYFDGIIAGALHRLMMQPAKPYTNPTMATYYSRVYNNSVASAKSEALHQNLMEGQTWRYPQGFSTSRLNKGW